MKRCWVLVVLTFLLCALDGLPAFAYRGPRAPRWAHEAFRRITAGEGRPGDLQTVQAWARELRGELPLSQRRWEAQVAPAIAAAQKRAAQERAAQEALTRLVGGTGTPADRELVGRWKNDLLSLDLSRTPVTDAGLELLKGLPRLQILDLDQTSVTDVGLAHLKESSPLQRLYLSGTKVTDAGLPHLKGLTQLRTLHLANTKVSDAGLTHLQGLTQLRYLSLANTQVSDAGVKELQQALPNCGVAH